MKAWPTLALCLLIVTVSGSWVTYTRCPGCIDRARTNMQCAWTGDAPHLLDPQNSADLVHLAGDAQLAEELAIRYADAEAGRRSGIEHHGGLLDNGAFRERCLSKLLTSIAHAHGATPQQIDAARGRRNPWFDAAAALLFLPCYAVGAGLAANWLSRRFDADSRLVRLVATAAASVAISVLGLQALRLWLGVWEIIRVGNGHIAGIRMATFNRWNHNYAGAEIAAGLLLFWVVAAWCTRIRRHEAPWTDEPRPGIAPR